jgi:hypothetical protein
MNLEEEIRQINNPQEFVEICNTIFTEKYKEDFQVINGSRADQGNDGYIFSEKCILAIYCPIRPEKKTDQDYRKKIVSDLKKAKQLHDSGKLKIERWTFVTPSRISNEVFTYLKSKATELGFAGNHLEATFLSGEFCKNEHLLKKFPRLHIPKIESLLEALLEARNNNIQDLKKPHREEASLSVNNKLFGSQNKEYKESEDLRKVFSILKKEQGETSKKELKAIYYSTVDKIAQVNVILGLLNWNDPLEDKDEDMIEWCELGARTAEMLGNKGLQAIFLSYKGVFLSSIWSRDDRETAFTIKAGNEIGIQLISEEQQQIKVNELHLLESNFINAFKEAIDIALELKNASILAQICMNIGNASGARYIHLNALGAGERAVKEKALSKRTLLHAKELYSAVGYELGVGYAIHNLSNQLNIFGEIEEAKELNKKVMVIAVKYNDTSLLQTARWLEESLSTGKTPDYIHGERRERKK